MQITIEMIQDVVKSSQLSKTGSYFIHESELVTTFITELNKKLQKTEEVSGFRIFSEYRNSDETKKASSQPRFDVTVYLKLKNLSTEICILEFKYHLDNTTRLFHIDEYSDLPIKISISALKTKNFAKGISKDIKKIETFLIKTKKRNIYGHQISLFNTSHAENIEHHIQNEISKKTHRKKSILNAEAAFVSEDMPDSQTINYLNNENDLWVHIKKQVSDLVKKEFVLEHLRLIEKNSTYVDYVKSIEKEDYSPDADKINFKKVTKSQYNKICKVIDRTMDLKRNYGTFKDPLTLLIVSSEINEA